MIPFRWKYCSLHWLLLEVPFPFLHLLRFSTVVYSSATTWYSILFISCSHLIHSSDSLPIRFYHSIDICSIDSPFIHFGPTDHCWFHFLFVHSTYVSTIPFDYSVPVPLFFIYDTRYHSTLIDSLCILPLLEFIHHSVVHSHAFCSIPFHSIPTLYSIYFYRPFYIHNLFIHHSSIHSVAWPPFGDLRPPHISYIDLFICDVSAISFDCIRWLSYTIVHSTIPFHSIPVDCPFVISIPTDSRVHFIPGISILLGRWYRYRYDLHYITILHLSDVVFHLPPFHSTTTSLFVIRCILHSVHSDLTTFWRESISLRYCVFLIVGLFSISLWWWHSMLCPIFFSYLSVLFSRLPGGHSRVFIVLRLFDSYHFIRLFIGIIDYSFDSRFIRWTLMSFLILIFHSTVFWLLIPT